MNCGILAFDIGDSNDITSLIEYAIKTEENGLNKFWIGEHYGQKMWTNPAPLLPILLGMTEKINIGAAGMLMNLHSSFTIASTFKMYNAFFPGRVDLGIAKGGADENHTNLVMDVVSYEKKSISTKIQNIYKYYSEEDDYASTGAYINPYKYPTPNVWMLGLSYNGLQESLKYKFNFSRSLFHQSSDIENNKETLLNYKEEFMRMYGEKPNINLAFSGIISDSKTESTKMYEESSYGNNTFIIPNILGCKNELLETMLEYQENYGIEDFIFLDLSTSFQNKLNTLEKLSYIINS